MKYAVPLFLIFFFCGQSNALPPVCDCATTTVNSSLNPGASAKNNLNAVKIPVYMFYFSGCLTCIDLKNNKFPQYERKYGVKLDVIEYTVDSEANYKILLSLEKKLNLSLNKLPVLVIGRDVLEGKEEIDSELPALLARYAEQGAPKREDIPLISEGIEARALSKLRFVPVLIGGLVDSINPCAFATIIFFLSYMNFVLKKPKKDILLTGFVFIAGVFLSYFLIGVGLYKALGKLSDMILLSAIMYFVVALFSFFMAYVNFRDALRIKAAGDVKDAHLDSRLPKFVKNTIFGIIQKSSGIRYILPFVFIAAIVITVLELFCTGQVYLPTIVYLESLKGFRHTALLYLFFYCLLFVAPLVLIFMLFYLGISTEKFKRILTAESFFSKLAMSVFFILMGLFMSYYWSKLI